MKVSPCRNNLISAGKLTLPTRRYMVKDPLVRRKNKNKSPVDVTSRCAFGASIRSLERIIIPEEPIENCSTTTDIVDWEQSSYGKGCF